MQDMKHKIWVERYRPTKVADCILPDRIKGTAKNFVENGNMPNLMLSGPAGTGKTTLAKALCAELDYEYIVINGSLEGRLIDTVRTQITQFGTAMSFDGKRKCVIIDEADHMGTEVQAALRALSESLSRNCSFIFTCNFPNRMMDAIMSRCSLIDFTMTADERKACLLEAAKRLFHILDKEGVTYDKQVIGELVKKFYPDMRKTINELQKYSAVGSIDSGIFTSSAQYEIDALITALQEKQFVKMQKWVASQPNLALDTLSRALYNRAYDVFAKASVPQLVLHIADYQYKHSFCADKEISIVAFLTAVMNDCEFK